MANVNDSGRHQDGVEYITMIDNGGTRDSRGNVRYPGFNGNGEPIDKDVSGSDVYDC